MHAGRRPSLTAIVVFGLALLWAALAFAAGAMPVRAGNGTLVEIADFAFQPAELTITPGETVTWTNLDGVAHTATATDGSWDTGLLDEGESGSITFTTPGTYEYRCTPHPSMTGRIIVEAAAPTAAPTAAPATAAPTAAAPASGGAIPDVAMPRSAGAAPPLLLGLTLLALAGLLGVRRAREAREG
jgi:plastocyanin